MVNSNSVVSGMLFLIDRSRARLRRAPEAPTLRLVVNIHDDASGGINVYRDVNRDAGGTPSTTTRQVARLSFTREDWQQLRDYIDARLAGRWPGEPQS